MAAEKSEEKMSATVTSLDPEYYKKTPKERFNMNNDLEDIYKAWDNLVPEEDWQPLENFVTLCLENKISSSEQLNKAFLELRRKHKKIFKKNFVLHVLRTMENTPSYGLLKYNKGDISRLKVLLTKKAQKSTSGVLVVTVITSPYPETQGKKQKFTCEWNCYYCPNEPGQPRSYLHDEPSVLRANRNYFDPVLQFYDRTLTLVMNGHPVDKIELLILGGTWSSYPLDYQESFIRDLFYAANTFFKRANKREKFALEQEKIENESADCKIIGITLETRPDCITLDEIKRYRKYGCTRVQIGVQHTDDVILKKINRGCTLADFERALKLLKDCCYKIDVHLMPNLPGSSPLQDDNMFDLMLNKQSLQADQWKIYPCEVVPWTVIEKWYKNGTYIPYSEDELVSVLIKIKSKIHPWIRLNRIIRDIPSQYIVGGVNNPSMRQELSKIMTVKGLCCRCIRCREVKDQSHLTKSAVLKIRKYVASDGLEYFISFETDDEKTIFAFLRLRIPSCYVDRSSVVNLDASPQGPLSNDDLPEETPSVSYFPELKHCGLIRELHVYGQLLPAIVSKKRTDTALTGDDQQHIGFGTRLMQVAEEMCAEHKDIKKLAVISGVGVRNFYRKLGYNLEGESELMIKTLADAKGIRKGKALFWSTISVTLIALIAKLYFTTT